MLGEFKVERAVGPDDHYGITAVFELGGTANNTGLDYSLAAYRADETLIRTFSPSRVRDRNGNLIWGGAVTIPARESFVTVRVLPKSDGIFENDETVTLTVIDAHLVNNTSVKYTPGGGSGAVTILQGPEFISDADASSDITKDNFRAKIPFDLNNDHYAGYIKRNAKKDEAVKTIAEIFAATNGGRDVTYEIIGGSGAALFRIEEEDGSCQIKATEDFDDVQNLQNSYSLRIKATDAALGQWDEADVTINLVDVDLDTDSDNNGYINTVNNQANGFRADAEDDMEETIASPITYFSDANGVPDSYIYVPLLAKISGSTARGTRFSLLHSDNLALYDSNRHRVSNYNPDGVPFKFSLMDLDESGYYVKATGEGGGTVDLVIWDANDEEMFRDTVSLIASETAADWIVPSGWRDIETNSFTTMTPVDGAVGPRTEGNSIPDSKGYTYSKNAYKNGFTMEFEYAFTRNGDGGHVPIDYNNSNEVIDDLDQKKISFVGNSGIKLGGSGGARDGIAEVQIIDLVAMVNHADGDKNDPLEAFIERINPNTGAVFYNGLDGYVQEHISTLMNGIVYGDTDTGHIITSKQNYREIFRENYQLFHNGGKMKVDYHGGMLSVYYEKNGTFIKYYEKSGVAMPDKRVYIQSHWGSGVTFSNVVIHS